jgi:hypothetical protein
MRGLAWFGGPKPARSGGFVSSVGLNRQHKLAIDPETPPPPPEPPRLPSGALLVVEPMDSRPKGAGLTKADGLEERSTPRGRIRLPR